MNIKNKKSKAETVISTLRGRDNVGSPKKGVSLLSIVQKLTQKREKASEDKLAEGSSE